MMLSSSSLVSATKRSVSSMPSVSSSFSSVESPRSTSAFDSCEASISARVRLSSRILTWWFSSIDCARRKPMLPPPAIMIRRIGRSERRSSRMTWRMCTVAARQNTSSPGRMMVSPSGMIGSPLR